MRHVRRWICLKLYVKNFLYPVLPDPVGAINIERGFERFFT